MKKSKILELSRALNGVGRLSGVAFSYAVAKNIRLIQPEIEALQKAIEPSKEFSEYDQEREKLAIKHAKKDEKGNPVIENNQYVLEDKEAFDKEFEKLKEKNKEVLAGRTKQAEDFDKLLLEEVEVKLYKVKLENIPKEITTAEMNSILDIIEE